MATCSPLGELFKLPLEIREIIYGYLTPPARLPTVLRSRHLGVSSVSHRPPPVDFLLACQQLCFEALHVYYRKCVFKFDGLLDPANIWPLWQIEEVLGGSELGRVTLASMRKIELNLFWHRLPDGGIEVTNVAGQYENLRKTEGEKRLERLERAVQVFRQAPSLKTVTLTWKEIPYRKDEAVGDDWSLKAKILGSLGALSGCHVVPGDVVASDEVEMALLGLVKAINASTTPMTGFRGRLESRAYLHLVEAKVESAEVMSAKQQSYFG